MKSLFCAIFLGMSAATLGLFTALLAGALVLLASPADAQVVFKARATFTLCPEFTLGGVTADVRYRFAGESTLRPATITSQRVEGDRTGVFEFLLPADRGTTQIAVSGVCRNSFGEGPISNEKLLSNCDALALADHDFDGMPDSTEDLNCNNFFDPADASNLFNVDTDGDGVRDLVEHFAGTSRSNPGSSPRPYIYTSFPFDRRGTGDSNAVVWRPGTSSMFFIRDDGGEGVHTAFAFGRAGDVPFTYQTSGASPDVGVVRQQGVDLVWFFHGPGFLRSNGTRASSIKFGIFGDNVLPGPWERPGVTNPAVARVFNGIWTFDIYLSNGTVRSQFWGRNGDLPKVDDLDGDGIFDIAVFRPSTGETYAISSASGLGKIYRFGSDSVDHTVRGDYTGDGTSEISFWQPSTGVFTSLTSDNGFDDVLGNQGDPAFFQSLQLGTYFINLPLNWQQRGGRLVYSVVDHQTGIRSYRPDNDPSAEPVNIQWGLPGDSQG